MAYLPKVHSQFGEKDYWDRFFQERSNAFEWYGDYSELSSLLHKYVRCTDNVLVTGCGNSQLSARLYDAGYCRITNVDVSDIVIKKMRSKNESQRPEMKWETMDVLKMKFPDDSFHVVLDKGTLDALMTDDSESVCKKIEQMFGEVQRVLRQGGRYVCVSLLQSHVLNFLLSWFNSSGWLTRVHRCLAAENLENRSKGMMVFPVFIVVCTKLKAIPGMNPILELCLDDDAPAQRVTESTNIVDAVQSIQQYAFFLHQLSKRHERNSDLFLELWMPNVKNPRYTLHIVDRHKKSALRFAVFVVPQGRETEWLFATSEGRKQLAENSDCQRLVVACLNRNHTYRDLDMVKKELSSKVMELAPVDMPNVQVPFLSLGEDLGTRIVLVNGTSEFSGDYVIEDTESENKEMFRRLIFKNNLNVIQSEAKLKIVKKKGKKKLMIDHNYLACNHHQFMLAGLGFVFQKLEEKSIGNILIVGLGGGSLPMYIYTHFPKIHIDVVEIDPEMLRIALTWFGFTSHDRMKVHIQDGLDIAQLSSNLDKKCDLIMLDVDSKDVTAGMSCPPKEFVEEAKLQEMKSLLTDNGVCVINLVSRNHELKHAVLKTIKNVFTVVYTYHVEEEVNEIVFCLSQPTPFDSITDFGLRLEQLVKIKNKSRTDVNDELERMVSNLKLL